MQGSGHHRQAPLFPMGNSSLGRPLEDARASGTSASCFSSFQKTVLLHDWWLSKAKDECNRDALAIAGQTAIGKAGRLFTSAPIVKRYDVYTIETNDGITVRIQGLINESRMRHSGFPLEACSRFRFGFPLYWKAYADKYFGASAAAEESDSIKTHNNVDTSKKILDCLNIIREEIIASKIERNGRAQKNTDAQSPLENGGIDRVDKPNGRENTESTCYSSSKSTPDLTTHLLTTVDIDSAMKNACKGPPGATDQQCIVLPFTPRESDSLAGASNFHASSLSMKPNFQLPASSDKGTKQKESDSTVLAALDSRELEKRTLSNSMEALKNTTEGNMGASNHAMEERSRYSPNRPLRQINLRRKKPTLTSIAVKGAVKPTPCDELCIGDTCEKNKVMNGDHIHAGDIGSGRSCRELSKHVEESHKVTDKGHLLKSTIISTRKSSRKQLSFVDDVVPNRTPSSVTEVGAQESREGVDLDQVSPTRVTASFEGISSKASYATSDKDATVDYSPSVNMVNIPLVESAKGQDLGKCMALRSSRLNNTLIQKKRLNNTTETGKAVTKNDSPSRIIVTRNKTSFADEVTRKPRLSSHKSCVADKNTPTVPRLRGFFEDKKLENLNNSQQMKRRSSKQRREKDMAKDLHEYEVFSFPADEGHISSIILDKDLSDAPKTGSRASMYKGSYDGHRPEATEASQPRKRKSGLETPKPEGNNHSASKARGEAINSSFASPELLNLKRSKSGRVIVPKLSNWYQQILYKDGSIAGVLSGVDAITADHPGSQPPKKRKKVP